MAAHSVAFDVHQPGAYAVQLRLTPALLEALLAANAGKEGAPAIEAPISAVAARIFR